MKKLLTLTLASSFTLGLTACQTTPTQQDCIELEAQLAEKTWQVEDLNHQGIIDNSNLTITFDEGRVYGSASCNRYSASYTIKNCTIKISQGLSTKMACPEALMRQEDKFLSTLDKFKSIKIDETGALIMQGKSNSYIKAYATTPTQ